MTCGECRDVLLGATSEVLPPHARETAMEHAAGCRDCTLVAAGQRSLTASLRALAAADAGRAAAGRVEARLLEAFAARTEIRAAHRAPAAAWLRVAAALVVCAGAAWGIASLLRHPDVSLRTAVVERPALTPRAASGPAAGSTPGTPAVPAAAPSGPPGVLARRPASTVAARNRRPEGPASRAASAPAPRPFLPLPLAAALPDFESGEIVRLGIPVRSLPAYGLEIPPDAPPGPVAIQADLLIGQDGLPRAIRLVTAEMEGSGARR